MVNNSPVAAHIRTGKSGENIAATYLRRAGYIILGRNVRVGRHDEIDIVACDVPEKIIIFAEVKTRSRRSAVFHPELNITFTKKKRMLRAARAWVDLHAWEFGYRLDVICVAEERILAHYEDIRTA